MKSDSRPDLPGLERVEVKACSVLWGYGIASIVFLGLLGLFVAPIISYGNAAIAVMPDRLFQPMLLIIIAAIWLIGRFFVSDYYWRSDSSGFAWRGILRRRFIPWERVTSAVPGRSALNGSVYVLSGDGFRARIPLVRSRRYGIGNVHVAASAWQHLRRLGKADPLELPDDCDSLWDVIPDEIPAEIDHDYYSRGRLGLWTTPLMGMVIVSAALLTFGWAFAKPDVLVFGFLASLSILCPGMPLYREAVRTVYRVRVNQNGLDADLLSGTVRLRWDEVVEASSWLSFNSGGYALNIRGPGMRSPLLIQCRYTDELDCRVFLAIVRHLRARYAIFLPDYLRNKEVSPPAGAESPAGDSVVLRLLWYEILISGFPFAILIGNPMMLAIQYYTSVAHGTPTSQDPPVWQMVLIPAAWFALGCWICSTYRFIADQQGVRKRLLFWAKSVDWGRVAGIKESQMPNRTKYLLKDASGKVLMDVTPGVGSKKDRARFRAFLYSKLREVLPKGSLDVGWRTRSWGGEE